MKKIENYLDSLGLDTDKWTPIFKLRLGVVNEASFKRIEAKHYAKVEDFVLKDTIEEEIMREIFKVEKTVLNP